jgi:hypothetical protein
VIDTINMLIKIMKMFVYVMEIHNGSIFLMIMKIMNKELVIVNKLVVIDNTCIMKILTHVQNNVLKDMSCLKYLIRLVLD